MPTLPDYPEISQIKHESPGFLHRSRQFPFFQIKLTFEPSVEFSWNFSKIQIFFCDFEVHITVLSGIFPCALYIYFIIDIDCYLVLHLRLCIMFWPTPTFWFWVMCTRGEVGWYWRWGDRGYCKAASLLNTDSPWNLGL